MIGRAERYLSAAEAQKVCIPKADKFEGQKLKLTVEQRKVIEQKAGVKVRNPEIRYSVAGDSTNILGVLMFDQVLGKHELIDYAAAISPEGKVLQVELLEYRENYGGEIHNAKWRDQFKGKTTRSSLKINDDIYNISGATLSCRNVTDGVRRLLATFELVVRPHLLAAAQLPGAAAKP